MTRLQSPLKGNKLHEGVNARVGIIGNQARKFQLYLTLQKDTILKKIWLHQVLIVAPGVFVVTCGVFVRALGLSCGAWGQSLWRAALVVVVCGLGCPTTCEILVSQSQI